MDGQTVDRRMCVFVRAGVSEENVSVLFAAGSMKDGALIILSSEVYSHSNRCAFTLSKPSYILIDQRQPNLICKSNLNQWCSLSTPQPSEIQCISECIV